MRITGDEIIGKRELDNFINPEERYPVIAVTSKLMTTGIDAQTCKLIVLDSNIKSMTEFKQIIGRGTRINEEYGKTFFTIMDFRNVTDIFANPEFDGDPVMIKTIPADKPIDNSDINPEIGPIIDPETGEEVDFPEVFSDPPTIVGGGGIVADPKPKVFVSGIDVSVLHVRNQYLDANGKVITESFKDYTKRGIEKEFRTIDEFLTRWNSAEKKKAIIEEMEAHGIQLENLKEDIKKDLDIFDLVCHIAWDMPPLTRRERAEHVRKQNYFTKYGEQARQILDALLDKYADDGIDNIEDMAVLRIDPFKHMGTPSELVHLFGGKTGYLSAIKELESHIYYRAA